MAPLVDVFATAWLKHPNNTGTAQRDAERAQREADPGA
jgi:hypothetical protein